MYTVEVLIGRTWIALAGSYDNHTTAVKVAYEAAKVAPSNSARTVSPHGYHVDVYYV